MNKNFFLMFFVILSCSSKTAVDMDKVLYDRSGQYITGDNFSSFGICEGDDESLLS